MRFFTIFEENAFLKCLVGSYMEGRPSFLGRGRGRGQKDRKGNNASQSSKYANGSRDKKPGPGVATTAWSSEPPLLHAANHTENGQEKRDVDKTSMINERQKKAEEIRKAAAKFYISEETYSSDSDEDVNDDEILDNTLKTYQGIFLFFFHDLEMK